MSCLSFSNGCYNTAVVTVQGSFTRDVRNSNFKNSLEGCFGNFKLIYIRCEEEVMKKLVLGYEIMTSIFSMIRENREILLKVLKVYHNS